MDTKRFGVIGVGGWGSTHVKTYEDHPLVQVQALCDTNENLLQEVGEEYGVEGLYPDYRVMFEREDLDAVSIVTPDFVHTEIALAAIEAGVDVLIEKPLATTLEECDRIGRALQESNCKFMVDFHNRWNPAMTNFKSSIEDGEIGQPQMAYYRLNDNIFVPTQMLSWAGQSTVLWFLASHCLDTLLWLFEDDIDEVYTVTRSRVLEKRGIDTPDFYQSTLQFSEGATVVLENCWILPDSHPLIDLKMEIVGDEGALYFDGRPHLVERFEKDRVKWPDVYVCPEVHGHPEGFAAASIRDFADCVIHDLEVPCGWEEGRVVTKLILAMEESARSGKPVELE